MLSSRNYNSRIRNATLMFGVVGALEDKSGPMRDVICKHFRLIKVFNLVTARCASLCLFSFPVTSTCQSVLSCRFLAESVERPLHYANEVSIAISVEAEVAMRQCGFFFFRRLSFGMVKNRCRVRPASPRPAPQPPRPAPPRPVPQIAHVLERKQLRSEFHRAGGHFACAMSYTTPAPTHPASSSLSWKTQYPTSPLDCDVKNCDDVLPDGLMLHVSLETSHHSSPLPVPRSCS